MTDSRSKLMQIQGKWCQERQQNNQKPEAKKNKNYSTPKQTPPRMGEFGVCFPVMRFLRWVCPKMGNTPLESNLHIHVYIYIFIYNYIYTYYINNR